MITNFNMKPSVSGGKHGQITMESRASVSDVTETLTIEKDLVPQRTPDLTRHRELGLVPRRTPDLTRHKELELVGRRTPDLTRHKELELVSRRTPDLTRHKEIEPVARRTPDLTRHKELEREYRTLKRDLSTVTLFDSELNNIKVSNCKQRVDTGIKTVSGGRYDDKPNVVVTDQGCQFSSHDFLLSDNLAMDHFKKHILNIKLNCRRHYKAMKQKSDKNKNYSDKIKTKFKPVFEQADC